MSKRPRSKMLPFVSKLPTKPVSDASRLQWTEEWASVIAANRNLQAVLLAQEQLVVRRMAERDGVDTAMFALNVDTWKWEPRP